MGKVLMIGAGGVATVAAFKIAQNADVFTDFMIASRTKEKCDKIVKAIGNLTSNLLLGTHSHHTHDKKYNAKKSLHLYNLFIMSSNSLYCFALQSYT